MQPISTCVVVVGAALAAPAPIASADVIPTWQHRSISGTAYVEGGAGPVVATYAQEAPDFNPFSSSDGRVALAAGAEATSSALQQSTISSTGISVEGNTLTNAQTTSASVDALAVAESRFAVTLLVTEEARVAVLVALSAPGGADASLSVTGPDGAIYDIVTQDADVLIEEHITFDPGMYTVDLVVLGNSATEGLTSEATFAAFNVSMGFMTPGDLDGNGAVDVGDLLELLATWGPCGECAGDLDENGMVDVADLLKLLANWG